MVVYQAQASLETGNRNDLILLAIGTIATFLLEYHNPETMGDFSFGKKVMASMFQSVTTRTAGFFTASTNS